MICRSEGMECAARFSRRSLARVRAMRTSARETTCTGTDSSKIQQNLFEKIGEKTRE